jgi:tyrosyl-tRNA synthetase
LNADKLSEYDYWQFWRNTSDDDVIRFLKLFTELPLEEIAELEKLQGAEINNAKIVLADEATALLHGRDCLINIQETAKNMFLGTGESTDGLTRIFVTESELKDGVGILDAFVKLDLASSKKDARRLIQGGGAKLDGETISDEGSLLSMKDFDGKVEVILRAGKKRAGVVELQQ